MNNKYICTTCNKEQTTEDGIYSVIKTGKCVWHATGSKLKAKTFNLIDYPNFGLSGLEDYLVKKMYIKERKNSWFEGSHITK